MIIGTHALFYSRDAEKDRAFLRDVLGFKGVDAGEGWLIMKLPPAEIGVHPTDEEPYSELYFICDDIDVTISELKSKGIKCSEVRNAGWGRLTQITLPSGATMGMYQPRHELAIAL
jgi:catechol 2,3-dioxygenase-like lactoylglutathione lyase family enzyme